MCVRSFWDVPEFKEIVKQVGDRKLLDDIGPHQDIWSQQCSDLQPADVGKTGDGV